MEKFYYNENQRYIIPTSDWGFKRLFGTEMNKGILIGFLNEVITDRVIVELEYLNTEVILPSTKKRRVVFDVYCRCEDDTRIIVEMQNCVTESFMDRSLVYSASSIIENYLYSRRKGYSANRTYLIVIAGETVFGNVEHSPVRLAMCDIDSGSTRVLNDKLLQIFIELPKFADSVEELREDSCFLDKFAVVMKRMAECETPPEIFGEGIFRRLFDAADLNGFNAQDKEQYKTAVMNELDYEATLYDFKERGRKEGREEGREEGIKEGLAQGLKEGEAKRNNEIAEKLKAMGLSAEQIKEATGIDI